MRIFKEEQRFTQSWLIVLIGISLMIPLILIIKEYSKENSTMDIQEFLLTMGLILASVLPLFFFKLITRVDEKGIHYRFFPFHRKSRIIAWADIKSVHVRKYDAISEYGGWGLKGGFRKKRGKAINVSGNIGIQLELKTSKKLLIGTQKESEAKKVLENYAYKLNTEEL